MIRPQADRICIFILIKPDLKSERCYICGVKMANTEKNIIMNAQMSVAARKHTVNSLCYWHMHCRWLWQGSRL